MIFALCFQGGENVENFNDSGFNIPWELNVVSGLSNGLGMPVDEYVWVAQKELTIVVFAIKKMKRMTFLIFLYKMDDLILKLGQLALNLWPILLAKNKLFFKISQYDLIQIAWNL